MLRSSQHSTQHTSWFFPTTDLECRPPKPEILIDHTRSNKDEEETEQQPENTPHNLGGHL